MKIIDEKFIPEIYLSLGDTLEFSYHDKVKGKIYRHTHQPQRATKVNYCKILLHEDYEGIQDCYMWLIGYKKKGK